MIYAKLFHGNQHVPGKKKGRQKQKEETIATSSLEQDTDTPLLSSAKKIKLDEKMKDLNHDIIFFMTI